MPKPEEVRHDIDVSILILLDYLFLFRRIYCIIHHSSRLNPYFTGLSILIGYDKLVININETRLNPYFTGLSILISYVNLNCGLTNGLNPYFTGLSILIYMS